MSRSKGFWKVAETIGRREPDLFTLPAIYATASMQRGSAESVGREQREDLLYDIKGGSFRPPPSAAAGGRTRPSSQTPERCPRCRPCARQLLSRRSSAAG
jgi:hypothetical protein